MGFTNFPNGITSFGVPVMGDFPTQGDVWFVKPYSGSDSNDGKTPSSALKTLSRAHTLATADQNDVIYMFAESNTAASTTDYQSATLTWSKDAVHLIGVNCGPRQSHRSRIAFTSTFDSAAPLVTFTADNCYWANIEIICGVAGTNPLGAFYLNAGTRNHFYNCHIAGIGHANNDIAGAYSLKLNGNASENYFENCVIGLDTVARGTSSNAEIYLVGTGGGTKPARNIFKGCYIVGFCESAGNYVWVDSTYSDRFIIFDNCIFTNPGASVGGGAAMTYGFKSTTDNGKIILFNSMLVGCTDVANDPGTIISNAPVSGSGADLSIGVVVTKA